MHTYDEEVLTFFLEHQLKLFPETVADNMDEADAFLEDCMAVVCKKRTEVKEYFDDVGVDTAGMSDEELLDSCEVFALPSGRFLIVEG